MDNESSNSLYETECQAELRRKHAVRMALLDLTEMLIERAKKNVDDPHPGTSVMLAETATRALSSLYR